MLLEIDRLTSVHFVDHLLGTGLKLAAFENNLLFGIKYTAIVTLKIIRSNKTSDFFIHVMYAINTN